MRVSLRAFLKGERVFHRASAGGHGRLACRPSQAAPGVDGAAAALPWLPPGMLLCMKVPRQPRGRGDTAVAHRAAPGMGPPRRPRGSPRPARLPGAGVPGAARSPAGAARLPVPGSPAAHRIPIKLWISLSGGSQGRPRHFPRRPWRLRLIWNPSAGDFPRRAPMATASGELVDGYANFITRVHNYNLGVGKLFR